MHAHTVAIFVFACELNGRLYTVNMSPKHRGGRVCLPNSGAAPIIVLSQNPTTYTVPSPAMGFAGISNSSRACARAGRMSTPRRTDKSPQPTNYPMPLKCRFSFHGTWAAALLIQPYRYVDKAHFRLRYTAHTSDEL